ncbi:MAG: hypothetical protein A2745_00810 [Candidatus Harrisonbacteria bacterium RIFCSPHIGHO2_01_FULL_44_13]|uniref:Ligand-binding protein SH3 n=1 Tax=Candidatus Harrisonbacteria bacterium RIFCSPLOWO2_01_FULL_44_18 TaxID=1798407 RepID=A0A1G1ZMF4_9BACT|nr:MAG: hypothetical protein A2745_00810 [Candidatus Harrisonbacteria bacterium RIFCSPHIGHO2_01_FULL_44_13]OGY65848.1 MAG: hypothetical protein A3A16_02165 [Candidatus Harrisonbacteria bacterium RIFCSPLOWO2_01_FULL_44_18]
MNEFLTMLLGASPVLELRGAIPIAMGIFRFTAAEAYFWSVLGNFLPVIPALLVLYKLSNFLTQKSFFFNRFFGWLFRYTRDKHQQKFDYHHHHHWRPLLEFWALFVFVAIPLPFTGAWSGSVVAFVFGIPIWRAALAIGLGVLTSGLIVLAAIKGIVALPF